MRIVVDDPSDPRIVAYLGMRDHQLRMRREAPGGDMFGRFVVEGDLVLERALRAGLEMESALVDARRAQPLPEIPDEIPVYAAGTEVLRRITGYHLHRGILALFRRPPEAAPESVIDEARTLVVVENLNNPTNLGVIVRSVAGLGIDGLLLDPTSCDPLYRRASRVAMGEVFALPWARLGPFPDGLDPLTDAGVSLLALTPDAGAEPLDGLGFEPGERVALVLGAEGPGLSPAVLDRCRPVSIPMHRGVDSLNVGAAAAVACWAVMRAVESAGGPMP